MTKLHARVIRDAMRYATRVRGCDPYNSHAAMARAYPMIAARRMPTARRPGSVAP